MRLNKVINKKFVIPVVVLLSLSVCGVAAWLIYAGSSFTAQVTSVDDNPLSFSVDFSNIVVDTQTGASSTTSSATLQNDNGNITGTLSLGVKKVDDILDTCDDYLDDCDVVMTIDGNEVDDLDTILITSGSHSVVANVSCEKLSCPQDINVALNMTGT